MAALFDEVGKFAPQTVQVGDFALDLPKMDPGNCVYLLTGVVPLIRKAQKVAHLIQRKSEVAGAPNETKSVEMLSSVATIVARRPRGRRK